jgi:hypothetical protein
MVSQAQEKYIDASLPGITKVSVNGPMSGKFIIITHLARPKVMPDFSLY